VYVPLNVEGVTYAVTKPLSRRVAELSLVFEIDDVLERVAEHGDLFAAVLTKRQELG
jgi:hypothetical protein